MEKEIDVSKRLAEYLIQHGYPEDSIILEWKISDRYWVDLAVIDNMSKKPVALFESKRQRNKRSETISIEQLKKYSDVIGDKTIPLYLVFGADNADGFEMFFLGVEDAKEVLKPIQTIPQFKNLMNNFLSKAVTKNEREKQSTFNWFKFICWLLAFLIAFLLFFDFNGCLSITPERLGMIAIIIGLVIVPFARKLSILGLEFERLQDESNEMKK
jgi:hypothetical protein